MGELKPFGRVGFLFLHHLQTVIIIQPQGLRRFGQFSEFCHQPSSMRSISNCLILLPKLGVQVLIIAYNHQEARMKRNNKTS